MKRVEHRSFPPFPQVDKLISVQFAPAVEIEFEQGKTNFILSRAEAIKGLAPKIVQQSDKQAIASKLGLHPNDINLSVVLRDGFAKRYEVIYSSPLDQATETWTYGGTPIRIASGCSFDLLLTLAQERSREPGKPYRAGSVLADISFDVVVDPDIPSFPIKKMDPQFFTPDDALWKVHFIHENVDAPLDGLVEIWINSRAFDKLNEIKTASAGRAFYALLSAEIYSELALATIRRAKDGPEQSGSLLSDIVGKYQKASGNNYNALKALAADDSTFFRSFAYHFANVIGHVEQTKGRN